MNISWRKPLLIAVGGAGMLLSTISQAATATALFARGCFWCTESDFEKLPGVIQAESGCTAGKTANPTNQDVSIGRTGHTEAVRVTNDPDQVSYSKLVEYFWRTVDPTEKDRQFSTSAIHTAPVLLGQRG